MKPVQKTSYEAVCETCGWLCGHRNALAAGAIHAAKEDHKVKVAIVVEVEFDHTKE